MFSTVCTRYIHVALAAYVPMLWERFMFGHSCNSSVVLSKNVSTWNKIKSIWLFYIYIYIPRRSWLSYLCLPLKDTGSQSGIYTMIYKLTMHHNEVLSSKQFKSKSSLHIQIPGSLARNLFRSATNTSTYCRFWRSFCESIWEPLD